MATHEPLELGNNHLIDNDAAFTSGFYNGNLLYYDTNSHPSPPSLLPVGLPLYAGKSL